jgi:hypothetical protein
MAMMIITIPLNKSIDSILVALAGFNAGFTSAGIAITFADEFK